MLLIVGLGNPGGKYERNRHNIGFRVVDEIARRHGFGSFRSKFGGEAASGMLERDGKREKVLVLKPMEFMNLSGHAVQRAMHFHDIEAESVIVVHDEIDLDFGRLKLKSGGGHGGHNGLRSIIAQTGSKDFLRVRCGVGKPPGTAGAGAGDRRVANYVLSDFPSESAREVEDLIDRAADSVETIATCGIRAAMNQFNTRENGGDAE